MTVGRERWVTIGLAVLPVAVAGAVLLAPAGSGLGDGAGSGGYERVVRDVFARQGVLRLRATRHERVVEVNKAALANQRVLRDYFDRSYLRHDIERNDPRLWEVNGRLVGMAPGAHRTASPFAPGAWRGDLTLASSEINLTLALTDPAGRRRTIELSPGNFIPRSPPLLLPIDVAEPGDIAASSSHLRFGLRGARETLADVRAIAGRIWIESFSDRVRVDGVDLPRGEGAALEAGANIEFRDGRRTFTLVLTRTSNAMISRWNGVGVRYRDEDYRWLAEAVEAAMDAAAQVCRTNCGYRDEPVSLTLDRALERWAQRSLNDETAGERWPAALTVMDARNGDLLALASHAPVDNRTVGSEWRRDPLNYNFQPMAVGSAAKPLIAAAILAQQPNLARLQVKADRSGAAVLGLAVNPALGIADGIGNGVWIDLPSFIQHSSNLYAAALMVMALDEANGPGTDARGSYRFDEGPPQQRLPARAFYQFEDGFYRLHGFPRWKRALLDLYGIDASNPRRGVTDPAIWRNLPGGLGRPERADGQDATVGFSPVSPLRQAWPLDEPFTLRENYIPVALGGEAFGWSTINLAQGYARLVTGTDVAARLVAGGEGSPRRRAMMARDVRAAVCRGMALVTEEGGTARQEGTLVEALASIRRAVGPDSTIGFFSKTGTPEMDRPTARQRQLADLEDQLLAYGIVAGLGGRVIVRDEARRPFAPMTSADVARAARLLAARGADPSVVARAARRMVAFNRGDRRAYVTDLFGLPLRTPRPPPADQAFGHVFVFVVTVHRARIDRHDCLQAPSAAFAVAVNVQEEADSRSALKVAARLLAAGSPLRARILAAARPRQSAAGRP
jgi:hypothetical protein